MPVQTCSSRVGAAGTSPEGAAAPARRLSRTRGPGWEERTPNGWLEAIALNLVQPQTFGRHARRLHQLLKHTLGVGADMDQFHLPVAHEAAFYR